MYDPIDSFIGFTKVKEKEYEKILFEQRVTRYNSLNKIFAI